MGWKPTGGGSSPLTTKGDVYTYDTADARLGVGSNGQVLVADSAQTLGVKWGPPAGSSAVPEWVNYLAARQSDETSHADDDFYDSDSSADYTEQTVTGTGLWSIGRGVLSCVFDSQSANDLSAYLKSITSASAPMTFETAIRIFTTTAANDITVGLLVTDGTATSSNVLGLYSFGTTVFRTGLIEGWGGTLTDMFTGGNKGTISAANFGSEGQQMTVYLRIIWKSANTWQLAMSWDGNAWFNQGLSNAAYTMTPTHFGLGVTTRGNTDEFAVTVHYVRAYDSDLSV